MKTRQELQQQPSALRKSPRLSSAVSSTQPSAKPKPRTKPRPEDAWALSLHVVEPQPLKICPPSHEEGNSSRRSSRFTTNKYRTPSPKSTRSSSRPKVVTALVLSELRRSPRFSSSSSAPALTLRSGKNLGSGEAGTKRRRRSEDKEAEPRVVKKAKEGSSDRSLRRSLRLSGAGNGIANLQLIALPEPGPKSVLSEKSLRSRTVLMHVGDEKINRKKNGGDFSVNEKHLRSRVIKCVLDESPEASERRAIRSPPGELPLEMANTFTDKCVRSRTVKMHVGTGEEKSGKSASKKSSGDFSVNGKDSGSRGTAYALIELPETLEMRNLRSSLRKSPRLNQEAAEIRKLEMLELPEKSTLSSEKCLRSRTVKMHVGNEKEKSVKIASKKSIGDFSVNGKNLRSQGTACALIELPESSETRNLMCRLRRSSGLNQEGGESPKFEMLELPDKNTVSGKKCLRTRTVKKELQKERMERDASVKSASSAMSSEKCLSSLKLEYASDQFPDTSEGRDKGKYDLEPEVMSEKCLRSRKIQFRVTEDDNGEKTDAILKQHASKDECKAKNTIESDKKEKGTQCCFLGDPIPQEEADQRWQWRYELKSKKRGQSWKLNAGEEDEIILNVDCHYAQAKVGSCVLNIGDCVYVKGEGKKKHVGRILEFFKTMEGEEYFRVQWFFRAEDTVLKDAALVHDKRRLFYSTLLNDNPLDCIISKVNVVKVPPALCLKSNPVASAAFYYDMEYCVEYSTFRTLRTEMSTESRSFLSSPKHSDDKPITLTPLEVLPNDESLKPELALLDLYSGCGGMSTGLCIGAKLSSVNLVTKWAVDYNSSACESLKLNHPETQVRNSSAEDFLELLRQWEKLCKLYVCDLERTLKCELESPSEAEGYATQLDGEVSSGEYEVSCLVDICYGDPSDSGKCGLHFKVRWKGYGPDDDTWESIEGLSNCQERIEEFVRKGFKSKILPFPGDVDVICGGPPCQGISGYNRFRNFDSPLSDERNRQIIVFMDIVEFLKPKYVLMENVVDIIRFDKASLGRYALSRLVNMNYQARLGTIASGCYGLPQFRLRVFIWGAHPSQILPQFPLPTHDVVVRYWPPPEFERNVVAYDEGQPRSLEEVLVLRDAISDLPAVRNDEIREEMAYEKPPETEFQAYIRSSKDEMMRLVSTSDSQTKVSVLYDHRPLQLSEHDYLRVCQVPHQKGANFRDFPGLVVGEDNVVRRDPTKEPVMLPTGRPLVPDCVLSFKQGKSKNPYARLWWDETVSTVVTFPHVRSQAVLHPEQDRLLTIREYARLQGFPDFYRFCGTIKERYCQIGNAVSIPVARALGYALGMAYRKVIGGEPLMTLPPEFSDHGPTVDETVV
ncbi:DNA (cytosine-5)-methyltransferase CMT2 [Sesamum indicum]|uniref:Cytosine-specific methyltransferase n=1 Tax=Sesamum indicum TaxID=4182 RepID=A0A6I9U4N8_SESIN|nr:DNA (cytosine-5)-methyltransferase CMT2 [Sesamum indicum]